VLEAVVGFGLVLLACVAGSLVIPVSTPWWVEAPIGLAIGTMIFLGQNRWMARQDAIEREARER
jgi:hypothetical protein